MILHSFDSIAKGFRELLDTKDVSEEDVHQYLIKFPALLPLWFPYHNTVFSRLPLGAQYVVDFAFARENSPGVTWHLIEIEKPQDNLFTRSGDPTARLSHALRQLNDWAAWFEENRDYVSRHFPFKDAVARRGLYKPELILVIGRRKDILDSNRRLYRQMSGGGFRIMTFDRLIDELGWPSIQHSKPIRVSRFVNGKVKKISSLRINLQYILQSP